MNEPLHEPADHQLPDELLRQAIASLADEPVPAGPPPELVGATLRALEISPDASPAAGPPLRLIRIGRWANFAAIAAGLLVAGLLARYLPTVESPPAFGQEFHHALAQVRDGHAMSYVQEMTVEGQRQPIIIKEFIAADGRKRTEMNGGITTIFDADGQIRLSLLERTHTAMVRQAEKNPGFEAGKVFLNWLQHLKGLGDRPNKRLGQRELDGRQVSGFVASQGQQTFTLWIDNATGDPVRIEYDARLNGAAAHITMKDFRFQQQLDESLFSFDVPEGYKVFGQPPDGKFEATAG